MQVRKADLGKPDLAARTVPLVLATDFPVQRSGYVEVLDIARVDLSRGDLPLIESHDAQRLNIGVIRNIRAEGGKLRGQAVFGTSARASEVLADVQAGIVTGVSIGYQLTDEGQPITLADGTAATSFGFMPYECSLVAVPADPQCWIQSFRPPPSSSPLKDPS
jgi:HK97 family phage prohead protease